MVDVTALLLEFEADLSARYQVQGREAAFELLPTKATAQIIIKEAVKREALGQSLYEGCKEMAQACLIYSKFEQEYREVIKRMQSEKIDAEDGAISFFYVFKTDEEKISALVRNEKIVTAFESSGYVASFRIYADVLTTKFEAAKTRANFLMSVEDCLDDVLGDMLPAPIVQKIAAYVNDGSHYESNDSFLESQGHGWGDDRHIFSSENLFIALCDSSPHSRRRFFMR